MWRHLKNLFASVTTYGDLSPDLSLRRQINRRLSQRPQLSADEWYRCCGYALGISRQMTDFVYTYLSDYSGLEFAGVRPGDRLQEDLHLPLVCWFDWEVCLCEDIRLLFGVDLSDRFNPDAFETVQDLLLFLETQVLSVNLSSQH